MFSHRCGKMLFLACQRGGAKKLLPPCVCTQNAQIFVENPNVKITKQISTPCSNLQVGPRLLTHPSVTSLLSPVTWGGGGGTMNLPAKHHHPPSSGNARMDGCMDNLGPSICVKRRRRAWPTVRSGLLIGLRLKGPTVGAFRQREATIALSLSLSLFFGKAIVRTVVHYLHESNLKQKYK